MAHPHSEPRIRVAVIGFSPEDKHFIFVVAGRFPQLRGRAIVGACGSGPIAQVGSRGWKVIR